MELQTNGSYLNHTEDTERPKTHRFRQGSALQKLLHNGVPEQSFGEGAAVNFIDVYDAVLKLVAQKRDDLWYLFAGSTCDRATCDRYYSSRANCWTLAVSVVLEGPLEGRAPGDAPVATILTENLEELPASRRQEAGTTGHCPL